jgi:hypothetical protein
MEKITVSERTGKLLAIYRDFNKVFNSLYEYLDTADKTEELLYSPEDFGKDVSDINDKLLKQIRINIEGALGSGKGNEI